MAKITYREFLEIESKEKDDFQIIEASDDRLITTVKSFLDDLDDNAISNRIAENKMSLIVDGEVKHPDLWPYLHIKENTEVIITPVFRGGKGGLLQTILGAVIVVVGVILTIFEVPIGPAVIMMGVGMMISGIASMLFAPDLPILPELTGGEKETKTYTWGGIRSIVRTGVPVPVLLGTHRIGGYIIGLFTKPKGSENYLYMLFALSEGEIEGLCTLDDYSQACVTSDENNANYKIPAIFINDQSMIHYTDVRWWARNGLNEEDSGKDIYDPTAQNPIPHFNDVRVQYDDGREVSDSNGTQFSTRAEVDKIEISLVCPSLYNAEAKGTETVLGKASVKYKIEYKLSSESEWIVHHPTVNQAMALCKYATMDDAGAISCTLGGTADFANCNSNNQDCSFATSKYQLSPTISSAGYVTLNGPNGYWVGTNCPKNIRIRIKEFTITGTGKACTWTTREKEWVESEWNGDWWEYGQPSGHYTWTDVVHTTSQLAMDIVLEILEDNTFFEVSKRIVQSETRTYQEVVTEDAWAGLAVQTQGIMRYSWPETARIAFGNFYINFKNLQDSSTYDSNDTESKRNSEFILASETLSAVDSEWATISGRGRNPAYAYDEIAFDTTDKYDIRVSRTGKTSTNATLVDTLKIKSFTEVIEDDLIYPNTALVGLEIKATAQLSGSPPNVTFLAKGIKVEVPQIDGGLTTLDDSWWNDSLERFEDADGSALADSIGTDWSDTTFVTEYTENFAAHLKNMIVNERYGAGRYMKNADLNFDSYIEVLQDCHLLYDPFEDGGFDFCDWWSNGDATEWNSRLVIGNDKHTQFDMVTDNVSCTYPTLVSTESTRKIETSYPIAGFPTGYPYFLGFYFILHTQKVFSFKNSYVIEITLNNMSTETGITLEVIGRRSTYPGNLYYPFPHSSVTVTDHKITETLTMPVDNIDSLHVHLLHETTHLCGEITNISIIQTSNEHFHTANGMIESSQSAPTLFSEMCNSFRCWLLALGKTLAFKSNKDDTYVHTISSTNIIQGTYSQEFAKLSQIPYILDAQFADVTKEYNLNTRSTIVDLDETNKAARKTIGLKYITSPEKIERELVFQARLLELGGYGISFKVDNDYLYATAGDVFRFSHPLPEWSDSQSGRILSFDSVAKTIVLDDDHIFDGTSDYQLLYVDANNDPLVGILTGADGTKDEITLTTWPGDPADNAGFILGIEDQQYKTFRLLNVSRDSDDRLQCIASVHDSNFFTRTDANIVWQEPAPNVVDYSINIRSLIVNYVPGNGFSGAFTFEVDVVSTQVSTIFIQVSEIPGYGFETITQFSGTINHGIWHIDNLTQSKTYYFRAYAINEFLESDPFEVSYYVAASTGVIAVPKNIRLFGSDPHGSTFDTKHVVVLWDSIATSNVQYVVRVYKNSISTDNLLVDDRIISTESFTYLLDDNMNDSGGTPSSTLIFQVASLVQTTGNQTSMSEFSNALTVTNDVPDNISSVAGVSAVGGAQFSWSVSSEDDHKAYYIRTKVSSGGTWTDWFECKNNGYTYQLTESDVTNYGSGAVVYIEVKDKDYFEQVSANAVSTNATAGVIADSIFGLSISASAGSGNLEQLLDGTLSTGGWTIG